MAKFALQKTPKGKPAGPAIPLSPDMFGELYPALWEHLTSTAWVDGSPRDTSSILLFQDSGKIKLMLTDKAAGVLCFVTGSSVDQAMASLEAQVQDGTADWRLDRNRRPSGR